MPIYMDFHDLPDGVTAAHVAEMHQADLKIEHKYNCRGLTYWCDERRQTAFCLIEAPNEQAIIDLHQKAHGAVPQRIIEVNDTIVESFLGRIVDPEKSKKTKLNIINDPAFRVLMAVQVKKITLRTESVSTLNAAIKGYNKSIINVVSQENGRVIKQDSNSFLMSFEGVKKAVNCAIKIQDLYNSVITPDLEFNIGISAGVPVTKKASIFEDTIKEAQHLCSVKQSEIVLSQEVKDLYECEHHNNPINLDGIIALSTSDLEFVTKLMDYTETIWSQSDTNVNDFHRNLGYSKSKLYRTIMSVIGKSPNHFLKDFRLNKALQLLNKKSSNISEIAYRCGFSSPTYFSKCFNESYGILPSKYIKQMRILQSH